MPFEAKVNPESLINSLRDLYGNKITSAHVKAYCAQNDVGYQTVTKYLKPYKKAIGKWNLCLLYTSPSPRDMSASRMPSSA